ncbi:hypothetical protein BJF90_01635 [Pseudonocardia sp. CNS-004]|nr:hypothetical protein BJF90_01635 [Pseudonocardia sp. CNS-004]
MNGWDQLGTDPATAANVAVATVGIVVALLVLVRIGGQRGLAAMSGTDVVCMIALGAIVGRTALLEVPSLATGLIALCVLVVLQRLLGALGKRPRWQRLLMRRPVVLVRDGRLREDAMRRARVSEDDLRERLRLGGIARRDQVRLAVLERTGQISVLKSEVEIDPWLVDDLEERGSRVPRP